MILDNVGNLAFTHRGLACLPDVRNVDGMAREVKGITPDELIRAATQLLPGHCGHEVRLVINQVGDLTITHASDNVGYVDLRTAQVVWSGE